MSSAKKDAEAAAADPKPVEAADKAGKAAAAAAIAEKMPRKGGEPATEKKKLNPAMLAAAAAGLIAVVGIGAFAMRGGGSQNEFPMRRRARTPSTALGLCRARPTEAEPATDQAALANEGQNVAAPEATAQASDQVNSAQALQAEKAKSAAAQAQLAAMKKAAAKAAAAKAAPGTPAAAKTGKAAAAAEITATPDARRVVVNPVAVQFHRRRRPCDGEAGHALGVGAERPAREELRFLPEDAEGLDAWHRQRARSAEAAQAGQPDARLYRLPATPTVAVTSGSQDEAAIPAGWNQVRSRAAAAALVRTAWRSATLPSRSTDPTGKIVARSMRTSSI